MWTLQASEASARDFTEELQGTALSRKDAVQELLACHRFIQFKYLAVFSS